MAVSYQLEATDIVGAPPLNAAGDTTQRATLGALTSGKDPTYGQADFIYVKFTGSAAAGDFVSVDRFAKTCTQTPAAAASAKGLAVGISMGAQSNGTYGWVMIRGIHDGANVASGTAAGSLLSGSATAGRASTGVANYSFDVGMCKTLAAANVATVELYWPNVSGR